MTPKSLLRHKKVVSHIDEFCTDVISFNEVLEDKASSNEIINTILLCSGKIYYDLLAKKEELGKQSHLLVRLEQIYPFPTQYLYEILSKYPNLKKLYWVQEEPRNMGRLDL